MMTEKIRQHQDRKKNFVRPTPSPAGTLYRSNLTYWPGKSKKKIEDGFPTRAELRSDGRSFVLGITNGFGTGKTELALTGRQTENLPT